MNKVIGRAFIDSIGTVAYIVLVASLMFYLQSNFANQSDTIFTTISVLLLFVCSAAITGFLVLGKPLMLYADGKKKEGGVITKKEFPGFVFVPLEGDASALDEKLNPQH
jgi:hypothetical protein